MHINDYKNLKDNFSWFTVIIIMINKRLSVVIKELGEKLALIRIETVK